MATAAELTLDAQIDQELGRVRELIETHRVDEARELSRDLAARWPDSSRVQHWARVLEPPKATLTSTEPNRSFEEQRGWLRKHARDYAGHWLALSEQGLVAVAETRADVVAAARGKVGDVSLLLWFEPSC